MRPAIPFCQRQDSPADRCRAALIDDPERSNREIALAARASPDQVASVRRALVSYGVLAPRRLPPARFPEHAPLPRPPWQLTEGLCVAAGHPPPDAWTEPGHPDRQLARMLCREACHVAAACLEFALHLPASDTAIYAGTTAADRTALRRQRGIAPPPPYGVPLINSRKTCCPACGLPLSGENLITEPGRRPGTVRRRCRACTQRRKAAAHAARREAAAARQQDIA